MRNRSLGSRKVNDTALSRGRPERHRSYGWLFGFRLDLGVTTASGAVSNLADQSGSARDLSQGTAGARPAYAASGGPNNAAFANYDGVDDVLSASFSAISQPFTLFLVNKWDAAFAANSRAYSNTGSVGVLLQRNTNNTTVTSFAGVSLTGTTPDTRNWNYWKAVHNGASSALACNGSQVASGDAGASTMTGIGLGGIATEFADESVAEYHGFATAAMTASAENRLNNYFKARYGL